MTSCSDQIYCVSLETNCFGLSSPPSHIFCFCDIPPMPSPPSICLSQPIGDIFGRGLFLIL